MCFKVECVLPHTAGWEETEVLKHVQRDMDLCCREGGGTVVGLLSNSC